MKKIFINGRFLTQRVTGVQRVAREYVKQMDARKDLWNGNQFVLVVPEDYDSQFKLTNIPVKILRGKGNYAWEQMRLPKYVRKEKGNFLLNFCNLCPLSLNDKNIVMIHDLAFVYHPEFYNWKFNAAYRFLVKREARKCHCILTVSEFSKKQLMDTYHLPDQKIAVLYSGVPDFPETQAVNAKIKEIANNRFYFTVGSASPNKNLRFILRLAKNNPHDRFVVSGSRNRVFASLPEEGLPPNLQMTGYLSDQDLAYLYSRCAGFIFPSLYEGFGLPPLEAIKCGCRKLIVSDIPTMHEIFHDLPVNYISPASDTPVLMDSFSQKMDDAQAAALLKCFSYEKSVQQLLNLIDQ